MLRILVFCLAIMPKLPVMVEFIVIVTCAHISFFSCYICLVCWLPPPFFILFFSFFFFASSVCIKTLEEKEYCVQVISRCYLLPLKQGKEWFKKNMKGFLRADLICPGI